MKVKLPKQNKQAKKKKIGYVQYTSPAAYTILRSGANVLLSRGWTVRFLGVSARGNADSIRFKEKSGLTTYVLPAPPYGLLLKLHYIFFSIWAFVKIAVFRPTVVYGSEPFSGVTLYLSKFFLNIPVIYHEHDPPETGGSYRSGFVHFLRNIAVRVADLCIVPGEARASAFRNTYPSKQILSIWNGVDAEEVRNTKRTKENDDLVLWYQGAIVQTQLPLEILDAIVGVRNLRLIFAGPSPVGQTRYLTDFQARVRKLGLDQRVKYLGVVPDRHDLICHAKKADIGLCLFATPFRAPMVGASQKMFEYLASGLPLLTPDTKDWRQFVYTNDVGVTCDTENYSNLQEVLNRLVNDRNSIVRMRINCIQKVQNEWNYEKLFNPVVNWLELLEYK
jgi:glycosyltransferase involved in cell wall biosynthesis